MFEKITRPRFPERKLLKNYNHFTFAKLPRKKQKDLFSFFQNILRVTDVIICSMFVTFLFSVTWKCNLHRRNFRHERMRASDNTIHKLLFSFKTKKYCEKLWSDIIKSCVHFMLDKSANREETSNSSAQLLHGRWQRCEFKYLPKWRFVKI